jgi:hypothetical protein
MTTKRNVRLTVFTVSMVALIFAATFLPASAQLSQWRSLNPTRDGTAGRVAPAPYLYGVNMLTTSYGWAVGGTCNIFTGAGCPGNGFALFWDGARWSQTLVPASAGTLTSVFVVAANDAWAVGMQDTTGKATILHWDGAAWAAAAVPIGITDLFSVFILPGGSDGWAVGRGATTNILRWAGAWPSGAWSLFLPNPPSSSSKDLRGVYLLSSTNGWAVGTAGTIFGWDGAGWMDLSAGSPTVNDLYSVFMVSPSDAWAVGASSTIIRWNGASWTGPMVAPTSGIDYRSIQMLSVMDGWIAGDVDSTTKEGLLLRWNGVSWAILRSWVTVALNDLSMLPAGNMGWVVGEAETIARWNGSIWLAQTSPTATDLNAVHMVAANDGWAVGDDGTIFRYNGTSWAHYETLPSGTPLFGLHMRDSSYGWSVGASSGATFPPSILRWNGATWTVVTPSGVALGQALYAVDTVSATEAWAVGSGTGTPTIPATMLKWDGSVWASVPSGTPAGSSLYSIDMLNSTDGWAVGCSDPPDIGGSCQAPIIVRWNGLAWGAVTAPSVTQGLRDVFMLSTTNGWAVGYAPTAGGQATIIHWDGLQWTPAPGPSLSSGGVLNSVHMVSATDGWAVGQDLAGPKSLIGHWDGLTWNVVATLPVPPTLQVALQSVFMVAGLNGWIVGDQGIILHYGPESVPGTTTSMTTVVQTTTVIHTTTVTSIITGTSPSATTSTATTISIPPNPIPGFPIESVLAGVLAGLIALTILRRRRRL